MKALYGLDIQSNTDEIIGRLNPDFDRWQKLSIAGDEFDGSVTQWGVSWSGLGTMKLVQ